MKPSGPEVRKPQVESKVLPVERDVIAERKFVVAVDGATRLHHDGKLAGPVQELRKR